MDPKLCQKYKTMEKWAKLYIYEGAKGFVCLLSSELLFYRKTVKNMDAYYINTNPYDPFVDNAMLNVQHKTITWNVEDFNVSHKNPFQVTNFVCSMATIYEK